MQFSLVKVPVFFVIGTLGGLVTPAALAQISIDGQDMGIEKPCFI